MPDSELFAVLDANVLANIHVWRLLAANQGIDRTIRGPYHEL